MNEKPNMVVVLSDQHSPHVLGCVGDRFARTPNLDALAGRGVRFDRMYCGNPRCVPSRMGFLTAQQSSRIGVWTNQCVLNSSVPTFAHGLSMAGYETVLCGRMHFEGVDQRHGFDRRLVGDVGPHWPGTRGTASMLDPVPSVTTGQAREAVEIAGAGRTGYQAYDRAVTDAAIAYLADRADRDDGPFCLVVGYILPHCPFICPKELFDEFVDLVDVPRMGEAERRTLHPAVRAWREHRGVDDLPDDVVRTARAAYYGLVTMMDGYVGEVLEALEAGGLGEDTAVFYLSDHGEMAGEHEMWWKSSFYEGSVKVPAIASWPGHFARGEIVTTPTSLLDVGPTLLELGGALPLPTTDGQSLAPFLRGNTPTRVPRRQIFAENSSGNGVLDEPPSRMIVDWPWKLIHFHDHPDPQLFNLETDPNETTDLAHDPAHKQIRQELHDAVRHGWDGEHITKTTRHHVERRQYMTRWAQTIQPPDPDHWIEPAGCTVFPEP